MFDQLHDPNPPAPTSHHLAVAAERAAGMRRRRNTMVSGLGAVALLAAGTVAITVTNDRDDGNDVQFANASLPSVPAATADTAPAPTTTLLDPDSLPPAVPVNPDPEDLPPAVPVNPDPDGDNVADSNSGSNDTGSEQATEIDDAPGSAEQTVDSTVTDSADAPADEGPQLDIATAAALRSNDPITAITSSDAGVWFPSIDAEPIVLDGGHGIERVDFFADGTVTIESLTGGSVLDTAHPDGTPGSTVPAGTGHSVSPDGTTVCGLDAAGTLIVCSDNAGAEIVAAPFDRADVVGEDLTWLNDDTALIIGRWSTVWSLTTLQVQTGEVATRGFAFLSDFGELRWAGRSNGELAVHDAGTGVVLIGTLDRFGDDGESDQTGTSLEVRRFDGPMRSVWYDGTTEILVNADGVLTVDGDVITGTYVSARR